MYLKLAWRNIWRNKRRTFITIASIFFAVILAILMRSAQEGSYDNMINNVAGFYMGYLQVHKNGYWEHSTIDNSFRATDSLYQYLKEEPGITQFAPRFESFALASTGRVTKGTMVVGIHPDQEPQLTQVDEKLEEGQFLETGDRAVLVAQGLSEKLQLGVKDTLILIGQGYHGVNAVGKYAIKGIIKLGSPELNDQLVYLPLQEAQWMYGAQDLLTSVAIDVESSDEVMPITRSLRSRLDTSRYEVMNWREMMPEIQQAIEADRASGVLMISILYMVIAFGIFGTILMMTNERHHEFGILIAIGMRRTKLAVVVFLEICMLAVLGVLVGMVGSTPIIAYFSRNPIRFSGEMAEISERYGIEPILPFSTDPTIFTSQAYVVFIIVIILVIYPLVKIGRLNPMEAIRN